MVLDSSFGGPPVTSRNRDIVHCFAISGNLYYRKYIAIRLSGLSGFLIVLTQ
jgi:hypothetical protein